VSDRVPGTSDPTINAAIRAVATGADPDAALADLLRLAAEATGASSALVLLWDSAASGLRVAGSHAVDEAAATAYAAAAADRMSAPARAAQDRTPVLDEADPVSGGVMSALPVVSASGGIEEPVGSLVVTRAAPWAIDRVDAERAVAIADLVAILVDRTRLVSEAAERGEWLERVSNSDGLTGLANSRTLGRVLELEVARAARQGSEVCLAVFDVDGLGEINDQAGRAIGDAVLREVAAVIAESVRLVDTVAREGGDEFVLVAPGAKGAGVIRRIVGSVAARPPIGGRSFTVSAGIARFPSDGTSESDLLAAANAALAAARKAGPGSIAEATGAVAPLA
jgi:diguanylate cyclase (GGDEF)-like protein